MGAAPEYRVRLSADGVNEVIAALKKVQNESKNTAKAGGLMSQALGDLQGILPQIGIAAAVGGLAALTKQALNTADAIGKLSQKTGLSAETLSVLNVAAETADANFEQVSKGLEKFNKTMGEVDEGSAKAGDAVRRLFGNSQALNGLNTEQRFFKIVNALGGMEAGYKKTKAAQDFFGKSGAELIPLLNDLSGDGFERTAEKAKKLGLIIDQDLANAAQLANDNIKTLEQAAKGAATQFASGLAPAIATASESLTEAFTGEGVNGLRQVGEVVGDVAKGIVAAFLVVGKTIGFVIAQAEIEIDTLVASFKGVGQFFQDLKNLGVKGAFVAANGRAKDLFAERDKRSQGARDIFGEDLESSLTKLFAKPTATPSKAKGDGSGGGVPDAAAANARLALLQARLEQELQLANKYFDLEEQRAKQAYEQGAKSLEDYYEERRVILLTNLENEVATLEAKRKLVASQETSNAAEAIKKQQELEAIDAQIQLKKVDGLERAQKLEALNYEQEQKRIDLAKRRAELEQQVLEVTGKTYEAAILGIQRQAAEMKKAGVDPATVDKLSAALAAQASFRAVQTEGSNLSSAVGLVKSGLDNKVAAGQLFPAQAAEEYRKTVEAALPTLQQYAQTLRDSAVTPEEIIAAEQYSQQIDALAISVDKSAQQLAFFKQSLESSLTSDLTNFFTTGIQQANSFGDAMRGLALSVVDSLKNIAAQMLANLAIQQLMKAAAGFGFSGGGYVGFADGGIVSGPGTGTSDSIPARLSHGEFVVRAAVVRQPGILGHLAALNSGLGSPMVRRGGGVPRFADGGLVTAQDAMGGLAGSVEVGLAPGLVAEAVKESLRGPEGGRLILKQLGQNAKKANAALGKG